MVLPETDLLSALANTGEGVDISGIPSYIKGNKTNASGACNIRLVGGEGKVAVLFFPSSQVIGGDIKAHILTEDTA